MTAINTNYYNLIEFINIKLFFTCILFNISICSIIGASPGGSEGTSLPAPKPEKFTKDGEQATPQPAITSRIDSRRKFKFLLNFYKYLLNFLQNFQSF